MHLFRRDYFALTAKLVLLFYALQSSTEILHAQNVLTQDSSEVQQRNQKQPVYYARRLDTIKPEIDGKLDDECWKYGSWAGDYHQWIPDEGAKPTWPTVFNIQYDDRNLYVAFRGFDGEPGKIARMSGVRDQQVGDMMGMTFDSYHDYRTGFEFTLTAWGQKCDLVLFNPMDWDFNWNPVWKGKTGLEDSAWVAEMEIPLSQLRFSRQNEQVWGMHTWRWLDRKQEESNWEMQSKSGPGILYNFGELRGITGLKRSRRLEIMPFAMGYLKTTEKKAGNPFAENGRRWGGNTGLDAKIGISSNFTLDLTVNPDFGQVESDPSVMNLSVFETFYEEKRPFFLEGLTIFNYELDDNKLFYSRRIGHSPSLTLYPDDTTFVDNPDKTTILSAVKFSGTTSKGLSVGLIQSITANEYAKVSHPDREINSVRTEPITSYTVARIQKGYKAGNTTVGGMFTSTNRFGGDSGIAFLSKDAFTGGLDLRHNFLDKKYYIDANLLGSFINGNREAITMLQESSARYYQRPGSDYLDYDTTRTGMSGSGGKFKIGKGSKGLWKYSTEISWISPGLELNDLGYMNLADEISQENEIEYFVTRPVLIFHSFSINLEQFNSWNFNGTWLGSGGHLSFSSKFRNNWDFRANLVFHSMAYDTRKLRGGPDMIMPYAIATFGSISTDPSKKLILSFAYDYEGSGNGCSRISELESSVSVRPFRSLKLSLKADYSKNHDDLQYVAETAFNGETRYILGTIEQRTLGLTFRADLNVTPEFSVQYYGNPFISLGRFSDFKRITDPAAREYRKRFEVFDTPIPSGSTIQLDENSDMVADYSLSNPDFNFHQFRSNLVARWEYRLGSFVYFVWSTDRTGRNKISDATIGDSYRMLADLFPDNILLIKLNYWFSF